MTAKVGRRLGVPEMNRKGKRTHGHGNSVGIAGKEEL